MKEVEIDQAKEESAEIMSIYHDSESKFEKSDERETKMRVENRSHIRHIMLYYFEKGWEAAQSFHDLNELFGKGTISESQCRKWLARFKSGDTSLEDKPGRGRPSDFDDQALLAAMEED
ncbi:histone-lysine N-methyltransferase SETMAR [Trichonephila clavipes]|nr:histone-lysine N-methyltransferase SETMAR [Trichonephila clavipes]